MSNAAARPARRIGNYVLGRRIGAGGMAAVFAARQEGPAGLGRLCAVKVMSTALLGDPSYERMFLREAGISARLEHRNAVRVYEVGEADGTLFIAMELVHGVSLRDLSEAGPLPLPFAVRVVQDVARALHAAHELCDERGEPFSLVHQDVTPHNVMLTYDGVTKLLDFGVARIGAMDASRTDTIRGKPAYLSPEQIAGKHIDRRTDVFAMGILLYELCTGRRLFARPTTLEMYLAITEGHIEPVTEPNALPPPIADLCVRALSRDRDGRQPDARRFGEELAAAKRELDLGDVTEEELGSWAQQMKPPVFGLVQLEREIVEGRTEDSLSGSVRIRDVADLPTEADAPSRPEPHDSGVRPRDSGAAGRVTIKREAVSEERPSELPSLPMNRGPKRMLAALMILLGGVLSIVAFQLRGRDSVPSAASATASPSTRPAPSRKTPPVATSEVLPDDSVRTPTPPSAFVTASASTVPRDPTAPSPPSAPPAASSAPPPPPPPPPTATLPTRISVRSNPFGTAFIDGQYQGTTPRVGIPVSPGAHTVTVRLDDGRQQSTSVNVAEGETKFVLINF
jgi:serine/threonine-protein kinase